MLAQNPDAQFTITRDLSDIRPAPIVHEVSDTVTYYGYSLSGTLLTTAAWRIIRETTTVDVSGTTTIWEAANGSYDYDQVWANRLSLSYSR